MVGTAVTAFFTRKSSKEKNKQDNNAALWDRTYKLIESQEKQINDLREQLKAEEEENEQLRNTIRDLEENNTQLKRTLEQMKWSEG